MNVNRVFLAGRLVRNPELRRIPDNTVVVNFTLAVNRRKKDADADFFDCEAWGSTAQAIADYLKKGSSVFIEGWLKLDQCMTPVHEHRSAIKVVVVSAEFINGTRSQGSGAGE